MSSNDIDARAASSGEMPVASGSKILGHAENSSARGTPWLSTALAIAFCRDRSTLATATAWGPGPKDTFVSPSDYITVWVGAHNIGGTSVWHCHILSHEDGDMVMMMRPLVVGTAVQTQLPIVQTQARLDMLILQPLAN